MHTQLYTDLGLHPAASSAQIKSAYRKLAKKHHPDSGGDRVRWDEISHAYEVLIDPARREKYDATGDDTRTSASSDPERAQIVGIINTIISGIMNSADVDPAYTDLRARILHDLTNRGRQMKADLSNNHLTLLRQQRFIGRFKKQGGGDDLIADVVRQSIRNTQAQIENIQKALSLHEKVTQVFLGYTYETDPMRNEGQESPTGPAHQRYTTYLLGGRQGPSR